MAKSSINPTTPARKIPKLELMAVDTAVKLAHHVNEPLSIEMTEKFIWTDSKTALQWLATPEGNLQVLPHNYCKKIKAEIHNLKQVRWVPGVENPADIPTRPKTVKEMTTEPMRTVCIEGPLWLRTDPSNWPNLRTCFGENRSSDGRHEERIQSLRIHDSHHRKCNGARRHDEVLSATAQGLFRHQPVQ
jgi:hypothetical protein